MCVSSEVPKTDKSFEERLIFKTFILKFVNAFTPIIYIAFFRGRWVIRIHTTLEESSMCFCLFTSSINDLIIKSQILTIN